MSFDTRLAWTGEFRVSTVAVAVVCKTPAAGQSKTRLSPQLTPEQCAALSAAFIKDTARTVAGLAGVTPYALYTPHGTESALRALLPPGFSLMAQAEGDLGARLIRGVETLLNQGHAGVVLIGADSPTLPLSILRQAVEAVRREDNVALSPAQDGGYVLIGLSRPHSRLFENIAWSTGEVYGATLARAKEIGLPAVELPGWYDVDDPPSLQMLEDELAGRAPAFATVAGADAPATRALLRK
jgi:rSAM/selenodomain-associated transferase 1